MALLTKVLVAHNLHKYSLELEKAFEEGWRVNAGVAARRSLGNRFTVTLVKDSEASGVQTEEVTVDKNTENEVVKNETKVETSVEQDSEAATETTSQEVDNSGTQTTDAENEAKVEVEADVEKPAKPLTKAQKAKLAKEAKENEGTAE